MNQHQILNGRAEKLGGPTETVTDMYLKFAHL